MKILINNQERIFEDGITLEEAVKAVKPNAKGLAAALNNRVVKRADWSKTFLHDNDNILIISAVCGG
ncbi:MAG: sulfur carrier protein ThiS [Bacteroidales bacterium]|nr:sulfur carrier protein ThiS [Bacteroidales bacterium]